MNAFNWRNKTHYDQLMVGKVACLRRLADTS